MEKKRVRDALPDSHERAFHDTGRGNFFLSTHGLEERRLGRAIGVVYLTESERMSHYFHSTLSQQFDAVLHFDETRALEPLDRASQRVSLQKSGEVPETYPVGV